MYFIFGTILINNAFQFSTFEVWKHSRTEVEIISPRGRVHRRSSLSRSDDVVCHNFTSDRIKGAAARPTTKILLLAHEHRSCSRKSRAPPPLLRSALRGCRCTGAYSRDPASPRRPYNRSDPSSLPAIWLSWKSMRGRLSVPRVSPPPLLRGVAALNFRNNLFPSLRFLFSFFLELLNFLWISVRSLIKKSSFTRGIFPLRLFNLRKFLSLLCNILLLLE